MSTRRSPLRVFVGRYAVAFVVTALFMGTAVFAVNYVFDETLAKAAKVQVDTAPAPPEGANYLVIGSDTRAFVADETDQKAFGDEGDAGGQRSDTMMVVHVEPESKRSIILSFPRDLWVNIPGVGNSRINAAFNEGPDKVIETLQANFGIQINHYIEVDFKSFQGVVRAIGNVPVYFPYPARDDKTGLFVYLPGCNRLNGPASLSYVRSRSLEFYSSENNSWFDADVVPDIDRIARQQGFIRELAGLAVAKSLNDPFTAKEIADRVVENLTVDDAFTTDNVLSLIDAFRTINPDDTSALNFQTFPWKNGPTQSGASVLYPDDPAWRASVDRLSDFSGAAAEDVSATPQEVKLRVLNGSGQVGIAEAVLTEFKRAGFEGGGSGNDTRGTVAVTEVRYKRGESAKGRLLLSYLPSARLVEDPNLEGADVAVVLGADFTSITQPAAAAATTDTTPTTAAAPVDSGEPATPSIANEDELGEPAPRKPPC